MSISRGRDSEMLITRSLHSSKILMKPQGKTLNIDDLVNCLLNANWDELRFG